MVASLDKIIHTAKNMNNIGINIYQEILKHTEKQKILKTNPKIEKNIDFLGVALMAFAVHLLLHIFLVDLFVSLNLFLYNIYLL